MQKQEIKHLVTQELVLFRSYAYTYILQFIEVCENGQESEEQQENNEENNALKNNKPFNIYPIYRYTYFSFKSSLKTRIT